jgi:flagellar protein FliJ
MRRFQFSLDPALQLRGRLEEQAQVELAEQQRRLRDEEAGARTLEAELRRHDERRAELLNRVIQVQDLATAEQYSRALTMALVDQQQTVREAAARVEECRETLQTRRADREALERLRDRRLAEHRTEQLRSEQQSLDEASILRWRRTDR